MKWIVIYGVIKILMWGAFITLSLFWYDWKLLVIMAIAFSVNNFEQSERFIKRGL